MGTFDRKEGLKEPVDIQARYEISSDLGLGRSGVSAGVAGPGRDHQPVARSEGQLLAFEPDREASRDDLQPLLLVGMEVLRQTGRAWRRERPEPEVGAVGRASVWPDLDSATLGVQNDFRSLHFAPTSHT